MIDIRAYDPLVPHLACPDCKGTIARRDAGLCCAACARTFGVSDHGVLIMTPLQPRPDPPIYDDPDFKKFRALYDQDAASVYYSDQNALFNWIHHSAHKRLHAYWVERRSDGWCADIGCGTGDHFGYFADRSRVIGLDMSLGSLTAARQRFPDALLIQADVNALPLKDGALSSAFSVYNLEHLYYLADALQEIERVLERGGRLLVGLPTEGGLAWALGRKVSMERTYSQKYGVDYGRVMAIEHCNTAPQVMRACRKRFRQRRQHYFPLLVPTVHPNLTIAAEFEKR